MYAFPNELQTLEAASKLLALFRGGSGTRADYFHCGYVLHGFALKQIVGEPENPIVSAMSPTNSEELLEQVVLACKPEPTTASVAALPPGFWRMVWDLAKKIIDDLMNSRTLS